MERPSRVLVACVSLGMLAMLAPATHAQQSALTIGGYELVSRRAARQGLFDYTYRARITSGGRSFTSVTASLTSLNPAVAFIEGTRWAVLGSSSITRSMVLTTTAVSLALFIGGAFFFRRVERGFADAV